jgi:hypothetical protein
VRREPLHGALGDVVGGDRLHCEQSGEHAFITSPFQVLTVERWVVVNARARR